jgi:uncharacterized iron-regulated membrane protein
MTTMNKKAAMSSRSIKAWTLVHKWSSLVCTIFMLLLCLTGLPLIFHHEIGHLLGTEVEAPDLPKDTPRASLDRVMEVAQALHPAKVPMFASHEIDDDRFWYVTLGDTPLSEVGNKTVAVDARTAAVLAQPKFDEGFMYVMFKLHVDLFAGLAGKLFLGLMGLLLLVAIVSGVVLYAPFMRKLDFGEVRQTRSRAKWLDLHNLLGIVTLVWAFTVGATGMINTWADLLIKYWQAASSATALAPEMKMAFIAFPGTSFSSPHHYTVFLRGNEPFNSRLLKPVLVDAGTNALTASPPLPWYLTALLVSQPLHFGDYGGMPMQILWALLDIATIVVLGSGLYLWAGRRNPAKAAKPKTAPEPERAAVQPSAGHKATGGAA